MTKGKNKNNAFQFENISCKAWRKHIEPIEKASKAIPTAQRFNLDKYAVPSLVPYNINKFNIIINQSELTFSYSLATFIKQLEHMVASYENLLDKVAKPSQKFTDELVQIYKIEKAKLDAQKKEAENNPYYQIIAEDYEVALNKINNLEAVLRDKLNEETICCTKRTYYKPETLSPKISLEKQTKLYNALRTVFTATPEQWQALFSKERIRMPEPIEAKAIIDVALFLVQLYNKGYIETEEYAAIIGRVKAFSFKGEILTSKQITATKDRSGWYKEDNPVVGKNYSLINKAFKYL